MNSAVLEDIEQSETEEFQTMGSFNHGYFQIRLGALLSKTDEYTVVAELSLDVGKLDLGQFDVKSREEVKPDLCVYPRRQINRSQDIVRMTEMPLLVIEILSPLQGIRRFSTSSRFTLPSACGPAGWWSRRLERWRFITIWIAHARSAAVRWWTRSWEFDCQLRIFSGSSIWRDPCAGKADGFSGGVIPFPDRY